MTAYPLRCCEFVDFSENCLHFIVFMLYRSVDLSIVVLAHRYSYQF